MPSVETGEWPVVEKPAVIGISRRPRATASEIIRHEDPGIVWLDGSYDKIQPGSFLVVETQKRNKSH